MKKYLIIPLAGLAIIAGFTTFASAASVFDIQFPVAELGNCADRDACRVYCDKSENIDACQAFAKKFGLERKAENIQKDSGKPGPGGCRGEACQAYCADETHQVECLEFGRTNGFISEKQYQAILQVIKEGGPGGCKGPQSCRTYCNDPAHIKECASFGEQHGLISKDEMTRLKKIGAITGPGGCKGSDECRTYCEDASHAEECIVFGRDNGFMSHDDAERSLKLVRQGGPGGCRGEACRDFCSKEENIKICTDFAEQNGLLPKEELDRAKKFLKATTDGGPGGCKGRDECRNYCADQTHRKECFDFAKQHKLLNQNEERDAEFGQKIEDSIKVNGGPGGCTSGDECKAYCTDPLHVEECITFASAHGGISKEDAVQKLHDFTRKQFEQRGEFRPDEELNLEEEGFRKQFEDRFRKESENFQRNMEEFHGRPQEFPGQGIDDFPGKAEGGFPPNNNEMMKKQFENRQEFMKKDFERRQEFMKKDFENQQEMQKRMNEFRRQTKDEDIHEIFEGLGPKEGIPGIFNRLDQKPADFTPPESFREGSLPPPPQGFLPPPPAPSVVPMPFPTDDPATLIK